MTEKLVSFIVSIFGAWAGTTVGRYIIIFIISLFPILELRGGLIAASLLGLPMWQSFLVCFIGNILPIPFILWFIERILKFMKDKNILKKLVLWIEKKADSKKGQIEKLGYLGVMIFVAIPLPGTGAWTGCLIAALLGMDRKKSFVAATIGVIIAGIIMLIVSYGVLGNLI